MAQKLPDAFIKDVLAASDIVDVVSPHVELKKNGPNHHGRCPFHSEKTGSFTVSETKQFFHCFGCGAHGDAIKFLMDHLGYGFGEAVTELASAAGLKMPETEAMPAGNRINPVLYKIMAQAENYYRQELLLSADAIAYAIHRGLQGAVASRFGVGYAPDGWQNLQSVYAGYGGQEMEACGLTTKGKGDRVYDRFRGRLMIPIRSANGEVIGFGGRSITGEDPKYLNSPDTVLFDKGSELFGIPQAAKAIREKNEVIAVEGFMDVISLSGCGVENVVGTMGTATTDVHVKRMFKMSDRILFCFDGDAAGKRAARRSVEVCLPFMSDVKTVGFIFLPNDEDPDSYIRRFGAESFNALARNPIGLLGYLISELKDSFQTENEEGRARFMHEVKPYFGLLSNDKAPMLRMQFLKSVGKCVDMTHSEVAEVFNV